MEITSVVFKTSAIACDPLTEAQSILVIQFTARTMASLSWQIQKQADDLGGLVLVESSNAERLLQDDEVLVEMRAASLNYRDLVLAKV